MGAIRALALTAILVGVTTPAGAQAQWLNYPTPAVPRLADGKIDPAAPCHAQPTAILT